MNEARIRPCLNGKHSFTTKDRDGFHVPQLWCTKCRHWLEDLRLAGPDPEPDAST